MLGFALGRAALALALLLQLLVLALDIPVLGAFARRVRSSDPALHATTVRLQCRLLRNLLPAPRFAGSLVEPRLYVGSMEDAHALGWLEERRVRSVLTAASEPPPSALPKEDVSALQLEIGGGAEELAAGLRHALPFLHDALGRRGGRAVLVHSCGGNGRACAIAAAFLMQVTYTTLAEFSPVRRENTKINA